VHCLSLNMAIYLNTTDAVEKTKLKYKSKIKELQADIDIQNNVKEQNEYIIKDLEYQVKSNDILCDVYVKEINNLESQVAKLKDAGIKAGTEYLKLKSTLYEIKKLINKKISSTVADCICKHYSGKGKCKKHDGYNNTSSEVEFLKELESLAKHEDKCTCLSERDEDFCTQHEDKK